MRAPTRHRNHLADERWEIDLPCLDQLERSVPRPRRGGVTARDRQFAITDLVERDRDRLAREADLDEPSTPSSRFERKRHAHGVAAALDDDVEVFRCRGLTDAGLDPELARLRSLDSSRGAPPT